MFSGLLFHRSSSAGTRRHRRHETRPAPRRSDRRLLRTAVAAAATAVAVTPLAVTAAVSPANAGTVTYVPWSSQLQGWTTEFIPSSSNDCVAGRRACVKATTKELARILQLTGTS